MVDPPTQRRGDNAVGGCLGKNPVVKRGPLRVSDEVFRMRQTLSKQNRVLFPKCYNERQ